MSKKNWLKEITSELERIVGNWEELIEVFGDPEWSDRTDTGPNSWVRFDIWEADWFAPAERALKWLQKQPGQAAEDLAAKIERAPLFEFEEE